MNYVTPIEFAVPKHDGGIDMTIGDEIWSKATKEVGMRCQVDADHFRKLALLVIRLINESHGIKEDQDDSPAGDTPAL